MFTLLTIGYVVLGALVAAATARFGATLATTWTGGDDKQLIQARKYASGLALVGGGLAACSPVNALLALVLALATGLFTAFCLGLLFAGAKVPKEYGKLLSFVDGKAAELNRELAKPETKQAAVAKIVDATKSVKAQISNLVPKKQEEAVIFGTLLLDETPLETVSVAGDGGSASTPETGAGGASAPSLKNNRPTPRQRNDA